MPKTTKIPTVEVDAALWERMKALVIALAIMAPLRVSSPKTHAEVVALAKEVVI